MSACSRGVHHIYNFVFIVALDPYTYTLLFVVLAKFF